MNQNAILEKGLNMIYSNVKNALKQEESQDVNKYIKLVLQIFRKRVKYGVNTKTSFKEKEIFLLEDEKLDDFTIATLEYFLKHQEYLKIAVEESLKGKGWKDRFYIRTKLKKS